MKFFKNYIIRNRKIFYLYSFLVFIYYTSNNPKPYIRDLEDGYRGIITEKYFLKVNHIKVTKEDGSSIDLALMSAGLDTLSQVNDSIIKIKRENYCILISRKKRIKLPYIFIPKSVRYNFLSSQFWTYNWPKSSTH